jgi:hypothetical protein
VVRRSSASETVSAHARSDRLDSALPMSIVVVAFLAAVLHLLPVWVAWSATPDGWQFTGNTTSSVDLMAYRVWWRQTAVAGPIVDNVFTSEPNRPHMVLLFAYAIGMIATWTSVSPELVYALTGSGLAFALTLLLYATVKAFVSDRYRTTWIFGALLVGGGLGAHLKLAAHVDSVRALPGLQSLVYQPIEAYPVFEDYRGHYIFTTLFDTHFLLLWLVATACMLALFRVLDRFTTARLAAATVLYAGATLLHLYEGVTLLVVTGLVAILCVVKRVAVRPAIITAAVTSLAVVASLAVHGLLLLRAGVPPPTWRAVIILPTILFLAYPLAWIFAIRGLPSFWREGTVGGLVLIGWGAACTLITLSGPFYPYPDRGTLTLQIPIGILAGLTYFSRSPRVGRRALALAFVVLLATPLWYVGRIVSQTGANASDRPAVYLSPAHNEILAALASDGRPDDVLLAEQSTLTWLAPGFAGRQYASHFFLTVDYERKQAEIDAFFDSPADAQAAFLERAGISLVFVSDIGRRSRLETLPQARVVHASAVGTLFRVGARSPSE